MPEGDSIYRIARKLGPLLVGKRVTRFELPRHDPTGRASGDVVGHLVLGVEARGKNLLVHFDNGWVLHTHLKMLGAWRVRPEGVRLAGPRGTVSVVLGVEGALAVCYRAPVARLVREADLRVVRELASLGPDLLGETFDVEVALEKLASLGDRPLGVALMDQRVMAGIGNVYKSELCFEARLDPFANLTSFRRQELRSLFERARELLSANVAPRPRGRVYPSAPRGVRVTRTPQEMARGGGPLAVYGRRGLPCFRCATPIAMRRQGTTNPRSTYYCPSCQPSR